MINLVIDSSRYLMIFLIAIYTYLNFRFFGVSEDKKKKICRRQNITMFFLHFLAYAVIYLQTEDERMLMFYGAQVLFFVCYIYLYRLFYRRVSRLLVNNMCILLTVGFIILTRLDFNKAVRQFVIVVVSALLTWMIPFILDRVWQLSKIPWVYGIVGLILLAAVCVIGNRSYGAQLSLNIRGMTVQPSEFVKISFVFFVATMFYRAFDFKTVLITTLVAALHILILVLSKDLGSALIFVLTYLFRLFAATSTWFYLGGGLLSVCVASPLAYHLFPHVRVRVAAWRNPWADIDNKGYQITQSLFSIGTGGWFGMGLYQGMPGKIPVVEKDFVFAAISEELGGIFALCILLICLGCFLQFMMIAGQMQAYFYKLIALGLGLVYIIQVFLTVGGVTKFIPSTGVTLPLVSYGGSSILSTFIIFGVIQGLYILKRNEEEEDRYEMELEET
ncbi:MAG: FtsW/RodA/SpoVE family cell cycle protein [Hungatella sp.]